MSQKDINKLNKMIALNRYQVIKKTLDELEYIKDRKDLRKMFSNYVRAVSIEQGGINSLDTFKTFIDKDLETASANDICVGVSAAFVRNKNLVEIEKLFK